MRFRQVQHVSPTRVGFTFKKKPVEAEAVQITEGQYVDTLEGRMHGSPGDWKVTGVEGEQWFVKPDIFQQTYEPVDDEAKAAWDKAYGEKTASYGYGR